MLLVDVRFTHGVYGTYGTTLVHGMHKPFPLYEHDVIAVDPICVCRLRTHQRSHEHSLSLRSSTLSTHLMWTKPRAWHPAQHG